MQIILLGHQERRARSYHHSLLQRETDREKMGKKCQGMIESKWDHTDRADTLHAHTEDAVAGSHHSWGAAYSSAHKRTKRAYSTQEIAAMQFTTVKQRWRTESHTHLCTFTRTLSLAHIHTLALVVSLPGPLNSSIRALFSKLNSPSDSMLSMIVCCVSSFVWAWLRGKGCFACVSALQTSCAGPSLRLEGSFSSNWSFTPLKCGHETFLNLKE